MSTDSLPVPVMSTSRTSFLGRLNEFLDRRVLPYPVRYLTNRVVILLTLCLLVPLILFANVTVFVLAANSYLNVMSVVVSSTVLLYSTLAEARDRVAAQRREEIAAAHQKMVDERADADHQRITEIHDHLNELSQEVMEHVTTSLDTIHKTLVEQLETIQDEDHAHIEEMHKVLLSSIAAHQEELKELRKLVSGLDSNQPS